MTLALWCVLIAGLLPYAGTAAAKRGFRKFDNNNPREWLSRQTGFRARGNAAQANSFEVFPLFAAAVIIASMLRAPQSTLDLFAVGFVLSRIAYLVCYLTDKASLRTLFFTTAMVCVVAIFITAARAAA
jgi:uncharacterized MAPEG superfamily protein